MTMKTRISKKENRRRAATHTAKNERSIKMSMLLLYQEVLKMSNEIMDKVLRIMGLAMLINPEDTKRDITDDKPTVFFSFEGHCSYICVSVHPRGWEPDYNINSDVEYYRAYLDTDEDAEETLEKAIERLEGIYRDVLEGKYNG